MADLQARPTLYKGIQMRSRLEAGYAQWLDQAELAWEYEPQCYASARGQYLPDFVLPLVKVQGEESVLIVETKPTIALARPARERMMVMLDQGFDPHPPLLIETPEGSWLYWHPLDEWAVCSWTYGPGGDADLRLMANGAWLGKWWDNLPSGRAKVGSAINP